MEPVIALHAPAAAPVAAAATTSSAQPSTFSPGATFSVVSPGVSPPTEADNSSEYPPVARALSPPSYHDNLKFLHIASSTDSTCSAAVSTPESKSSDCPPSPKHAEFDHGACSPPQSSSVTQDHGSYNGGRRSGGEAANGDETAEESLLPAQVKKEELGHSSCTQERHATSAAASFLRVPPPLGVTAGDSRDAPVAALLAAAATAAAPLRTTAAVGVATELAEAILQGHGPQRAEPALRTAAAAPAEGTGAADGPAVETLEHPGQHEVDVAVIGAGLAGLTAALAIHKQTRRVVHVFEKEMCCGEESFLRGDTQGWDPKLTAVKALTAEARNLLSATTGETGINKGQTAGLPKEANALSVLGSGAVGGAMKHADDREILLQANGLDALRCIDEQLACDVLESGHIVYSDSLDVFDWEAKQASTTLVFGIYWSDLRQILYRHCQRYRDSIIFVFGKELKAAVGGSCMSSAAEGGTSSAVVCSAASPSPRTISTLLSSPLSSSTISTPSSCSAYSSSLSGTPIVGNSTHFTSTKSPNSLKQQDKGHAEVELSHNVAAVEVKGGKMHSFCREVSDASTAPWNGIRLCFHDGTQVNAKLVIGADGPESCARKTSAMGLDVSNKAEQTKRRGNSPSASRSFRLQYQGLTELGSGQDEVPENIWLYHKKSGHHVSMIKTLGPNILTWSLTRNAPLGKAHMAENDWKAYVLETVGHMKEDASEKTRKAFELLYHLIERTSQEDIQCVSLPRPTYQDCRWTRLNDRLVLVGNATIEDTAQLAYCLRDWSANDVLATQRFASIRKHSLSRVVKLSEAVNKAIWSNEEVWKRSDGALHEMKMDTEASHHLYLRANFVPVRSFFRANESQALMENAELETEYM